MGEAAALTPCIENEVGLVFDEVGVVTTCCGDTNVVLACVLEEGGVTLSLSLSVFLVKVASEDTMVGSPPLCLFSLAFFTF